MDVIKAKVGICPVPFCSPNKPQSQTRPQYPTGGVVLIAESGQKQVRSNSSTDEPSKTDKKFVCLSCPFHVEFPTESLYLAHMNIAHVNHASTVESPGLTSSSISNVNRSAPAKKLIHSGSNHCRVCSSCFESAENLHIHQVLSGHSHIFYKFCQHCPFACRNEPEMAQHVESAHPDVASLNVAPLPTAPLLFRCILENCSASFSDGLKLSEHAEKYHKKKAFVCQKCFMMFRYRDGLALHQKASCKGFPPSPQQLQTSQNSSPESGRKSRNGASSPQKRQQISADFTEDGTTSKRGRGRPKKSPSETVIKPPSPKVKRQKSPKLTSVSPISEGNSSKKRRGRPKKMSVGTLEEVSSSAQQKNLEKVDILADHDPTRWEKVQTEKGSRYLCKICNKLIEGKTQMSDHLDFHAGIKSHKCSVCGKEFSYKRKMTRHKLRHAPHLDPDPQEYPDQPVEPTCQPSSALIPGNKPSEKPGVKRYKCTTCNRSFATYLTFWFHSQSHKRNNPAPVETTTNTSKQAKIGNKQRRTLKCRYCEKQFVSPVGVRDHENEHLGVQAYQCQFCAEKFTHQIVFNVHVKNVHKTTVAAFEQQKLSTEPPPAVIEEVVIESGECQKDDPADVDIDEDEEGSLGWEQIRTNQGLRFACKSCNKTFTDEVALHQHVDSHSTEGQFKCQICGKKFVRKQRLLAHRRVHDKTVKTKSRSKSCATCGKSFVSAIDLRDHEDKHAGICRYKCEFCGDLFGTHIAYQTHLRNHNNPGGKKSAKPKQVYICSQCGQQFARIETLRDHENIHTGARPYTCQFCSATFANKSVFNQHLKVTHKDQMPYKCSFCSSKAFKDETGLRRHQIQRHQAEIAALHSTVVSSPTHVICDVCGSKFIDAQTLATHKAWAHKASDGTPFSCEFCPRKFAALAALNTHRARAHSAEDYSKIQQELPIAIMADETD